MPTGGFARVSDGVSDGTGVAAVAPAGETRGLAEPAGCASDGTADAVANRALRAAGRALVSSTGSVRGARLRETTAPTTINVLTPMAMVTAIKPIRRRGGGSKRTPSTTSGNDEAGGPSDGGGRPRRWGGRPQRREPLLEVVRRRRGCAPMHAALRYVLYGALFGLSLLGYFLFGDFFESIECQFGARFFERQRRWRSADRGNRCRVGDRERHVGYCSAAVRQGPFGGGIGRGSCAGSHTLFNQALAHGGKPCTSGTIFCRDETSCA